MVSLLICRRFDLLSDHTQFDLRPSLFARRRRRRQWPYLLPLFGAFPANKHKVCCYVHACAPAMAGRRHQKEHDHQHLNAVVVATCHLGHKLAGAFFLPSSPSTPLVRIPACMFPSIPLPTNQYKPSCTYVPPATCLLAFMHACPPSL
jgi:hypothetical protein